jgi:hypothetical protein
LILLCVGLSFSSNKMRGVASSFLTCRKKEEFFELNTSPYATCIDSSCEETIHAMKKAIILGSALSVFGFMLVSCSSEPEATTTTTRQTTVTTPVPPPTSQTTTTTTHQMGGY